MHALPKIKPVFISQKYLTRYGTHAGLTGGVSDDTYNNILIGLETIASFLSVCQIKSYIYNRYNINYLINTI